MLTMSAVTRARSGPATAAHGGGLAARLGRHRWVASATVAVCLAIVVVPSGLSPVARLTLALFATLVVLTSFSDLNEVAVCIAVLAGLVAVGGSSVGDAASAATGDTVWLLIGAFVVAAAARASGIAERVAFAIGSPAQTVSGLAWRLTFGIVATAFVVPSTSGRAALLLPVYLAVADHLPEVRARRALSVLFPSVVLLSAVASLFGAGAHLVTVELVAGLGGDPIGLVEWTLYGLPFALASSSVATWVILRMFLDEEQRIAAVDLPVEQPPWGRSERIVGTVLAVMVLLWLTESIHGVSPAVVALVGAAVVLIGPLAVVTLRDAWGSIPVGLLVLLVVTAEAGAALARTGGADWIASTVLGPIMDGQSPAVAVVAVVAIVSLMMHLVITSRTARASVLVPIVILIAGAAGLDITAVAFLATVGAGYCLTTTTSAKPIRVFATVDDGFGARDLRRLSVRLVPIHFLLLLGFTFFAWPALGMPIDERPADRAAEERVYPWDRIVIADLDLGPRLDRSVVEEPPSATPSRIVLPLPTAPGSSAADSDGPDGAVAVRTVPAAVTQADEAPGTVRSDDDDEETEDGADAGARGDDDEDAGGDDEDDTENTGSVAETEADADGVTEVDDEAETGADDEGEQEGLESTGDPLTATGEIDEVEPDGDGETGPAPDGAEAPGADASREPVDDDPEDPAADPGTAESDDDVAPVDEDDPGEDEPDED